VQIHLHAILTSARDCGERPALRNYRFTLEGEKVPYILGRWVGPRDGVDAVEKTLPPRLETNFLITTLNRRSAAVSDIKNMSI